MGSADSVNCKIISEIVRKFRSNKC